jgi:hypothetical protein
MAFLLSLYEVYGNTVCASVGRTSAAARARGDAATDRDAQKRRAATIASATIAVTCRARVARVARRARDGGGAF